MAPTAIIDQNIWPQTSTFNDQNAWPQTSPEENDQNLIAQPQTPTANATMLAPTAVNDQNIWPQTRTPVNDHNTRPQTPTPEENDQNLMAQPQISMVNAPHNGENIPNRKRKRVNDQNVIARLAPNHPGNEPTPPTPEEEHAQPEDEDAIFTTLIPFVGTAYRVLEIRYDLLCVISFEQFRDEVNRVMGLPFDFNGWGYFDLSYPNF